MNWSLLFKRDDSAPVACERLQILLAQRLNVLRPGFETPG